MKKNLKKKNIFKVLRKIRDIKVTDLAKALDVSPANISSIEAGRHCPSKRLLTDYAQALGVTPEFINNHLPCSDESKKDDERYEEYMFGVLNDVLALEKERRSLTM